MKELLAKPKPQPSPEDYVAAQHEYESETGLKFADLPTRKRNMLAKDQYFHRGYHDLCDAIMGVK